MSSLQIITDSLIFGFWPFPVFLPVSFCYFFQPKEFETDTANPIWSSSLSPPSPKQNDNLNPALWKIEVNKNYIPGKKKILDN